MEEGNSRYEGFNVEETLSSTILNFERRSQFPQGFVDYLFPPVIFGVCFDDGY